jgi:hypothetical protein
MGILGFPNNVLVRHAVVGNSQSDHDVFPMELSKAALPSDVCQRTRRYFDGE